MLTRLGAFIWQRFLLHAAPLVLWVVVMDVLVQRLHGAARFVPSWATALAVASALLIGLVIRVSDELKDEETDRVHHPDRPLPAGHVSRRELEALRLVAVALLVGLNGVWRLALVEALVIVGYLFLMASWFFAPARMQRSRMLVLVTHSPVYLLLNAYLIATSVRWHGYTGVGWLEVALAVWTMLPFYSFELARKTFAAAEEPPGYSSYSAALGPRAAAIVGLVFAALHLAGFVWLAGPLRLAGWLAPAAGVLLGLYVLTCGRFVAGGAKGAHLAQASGSYWMVALVLVGLGAAGLSTWVR